MGSVLREELSPDLCCSHSPLVYLLKVSVVKKFLCSTYVRSLLSCPFVPEGIGGEAQMSPRFSSVLHVIERTWVVSAPGSGLAGPWRPTAPSQRVAKSESVPYSPGATDSEDTQLGAKLRRQVYLRASGSQELQKRNRRFQAALLVCLSPGVESDSCLL